MRTIEFIVLVGSLVSVTGCGGDDATAVAGQGDDSGAPPDGTTVTVDGSSSTSDGSSSVDGATIASDSAARGPNGSVVADGGVGGDAGPGGNTSTLPCGGATCNVPSESCCVTSGGGAPGYECVVGPACPGGDGGRSDTVALQCTSAANCAAGTVCCMTASNNSVSSQCTPASSDGGDTCTGQDSAQLCDKNANGTATGCPAGGQNSQCSSDHIDAWGLPGTFATCGGKDGPF
jgi:hypothetical protein